MILQKKNCKKMQSLKIFSPFSMCGITYHPLSTLCVYITCHRDD